MVLGRRKVSKTTKSDDTDTHPDPTAKYTMAQTKDGDLSRPSGLPNNGNPSSSSVIPPPSKSGPAAPTTKNTGTPVAPQRNRRRKVSQ
ncbi:hypothetical protein CAEBREN_29499 [Caenorhabditis brenneri]|uniref:Uncharacterized protein n=1 Tax=Caenorhabditis brenneri TaxID=135651 RepID=G0P7K2_CAEBE|nr:hypothetical protein CAEBREN_29499 [Caenorhabditis brenneri]